MDTAVKPGDDFFKYANGKWLATFKMPADKARFGAFDALGDKSEADVKTVVEVAGRPEACRRHDRRQGRRHVFQLDGRGGD